MTFEEVKYLIDNIRFGENNLSENLQLLNNEHEWIDVYKTKDNFYIFESCRYRIKPAETVELSADLVGRFCKTKTLKTNIL
jgi:hypothetical protein